MWLWPYCDKGRLANKQIELQQLSADHRGFRVSESSCGFMLFLVHVNFHRQCVLVLNGRLRMLL